MSRITIGSVVVDRCPACGGVWLDKGELDAIREAFSHHGAAAGTPVDPPAIDTEHRDRPLECPRDRSRLSVHRDPKQRHIEYDTCSKCGGMFLDAGELRDLTEFTLKERLRSLWSRG